MLVAVAERLAVAVVVVQRWTEDERRMGEGFVKVWPWMGEGLVGRSTVGM